jgi:hypothetical protein
MLPEPKRLTFCLLLSCTSTLTFAGGSPLTLVKDGRPTSVLVTSDRPLDCQTEAARELQDHLKLMTGALVPIVREGELRADAGLAVVLVGQSKLLAKHGVDTAKLEPETFVVKTVGDALLLAGDDGSTPKHSRTGTLWAVYDFLQDQLGCRWIWPGESGRVVPRRATVAVGDLDLRETPVIKRRHIRAVLNERFKQTYLADKLDRFLDLGDTYDRLEKDETLWLQRLRRGSSFYLSYGHAFTDWWERYKDRDPSLFALQPNGKRGPSKADRPDFVKMCVSNPRLWDLQLGQLRSAVKKGSENLFLNVAENDGGGGFCVCPNCRAWDADPSAGLGKTALRKQEDGAEVDLDPTQVDTSPLPDSLSDRYARWYNELAVRAREIHPDAKVIAYAYSRYTDPPARIDHLEPNVWIGYVGFNAYPRTAEQRQQCCDTWHGWSGKGATVFLRSNSLFFAGEGAPYVFSHQLAEDFRFQVENGMRATDFDCLQGHWATTGPTYYVLARLLWDTNAEVERLLDEFYSAFGPLKPVVKEYFDYWEAFTLRLTDDPNFRDRTRVEKKQSYPALYPQSAFTGARAILDKAKLLQAQSATEDRERFHNLELGLDHAELMVEALKSGKLLAGEAGRKLMVLRREIAARNVVNVYWLTHREKEYRLFE